MEPIRSPRNPAVVEAGRLHRSRERKATGKTLLEGPNLLDVAVRSNLQVERTFALADDPRRDEWPAVSVVEAPVMRKLAATETPRGPVAVVEIPAWRPAAIDRDILALFGVADPGNVGTIIRSASGFGLGVAIGPDCADPWSPKVLRAGAGGHFRLPSLTRIEGTDDLPSHRLVATVVEGGRDPSDLGPGPSAFLIGSEAHGLDPETTATAHEMVTIPMVSGTESLNAAVAASILAYVVSIRSRGRPAAH